MEAYKIEKNHLLAAKWYERAAQLGSNEAQYALGWLYFYGEGVNPNSQSALQWLKSAANSGNKKGVDALRFIQLQNPNHTNSNYVKK